MVGKTVNHYKILEKIGEGGMGEVYRAEDTELGRIVAIKVLPEKFTQDPQRLARFEREAKLLASLNHPNIAVIHSLEQSDGVRFLTLELVKGQTLAERLKRGALPVREALEICGQIAEGIQAAHENGVFHRDLKPSNLIITPEGNVKILDFGLGKAFDSDILVSDISKSPTLTDDMTQSGMILGTAAYMSPEQARGNAVDKRADIWGFGCVLYEALTGKRAFDGRTVTETLAKILESEVQWEILPGTIPSTIRFLLDKCLQKDLNRRLQHIDGARILVEEALVGSPKQPLMEVASPTHGHQLIPWGLAILMAFAALFLWSPWEATSTEPLQLRRFTIDLPTSYVDGPGSTMALSPDGQHLVYVGRQGNREVIYHQAMDQLQPELIAGTEGAHGLFFSPDSQWVGFHAAGKLKKVSPGGGSPQTICDVNEMLGASWGQDDNIIFGDGTSGLYQVPAGGGTPQRLTTPNHGEGEAGHRWPEILPGEQTALFTIWTGGFYNADRIGVLSLETGEWEVLVEGGSSPRYLPTGHLTYVRSDMLMAAPFDLTSLEVIGEPIAILEDLSVNIGGVSHSTFAEDGTLVYLSIQEATDRKLVWVDREGSESLLTEDRRTYATPHISPDGNRIAFCVYEGGMPDSVWIYDTEEDFFSRMTFEGETRDCAPIWSPDGKWIAFQSDREGERRIYRQLADRSGPEELLLSSSFLQVPTGWSPDGSVFTYFEARPETNYDIWSISMDSDSEPQILVGTPDYDCCPAFSPDGRWMAYVSGDINRAQIYVRSYPGSDVTFLVSGEEGGGEPIWSADGTELFYRVEGKTMVVSIETEPGFRAGRPRVLFEGPYVSSSITPGYWYFDVTPDGQRFLIIQSEEESAQINVVLNWFEELKRLVPTDK